MKTTTQIRMVVSIQLQRYKSSVRLHANVLILMFAEVRDGTPGPNTGRPGIDYPALAEIPSTSFNCKEQRYKGFFGDPETHCQVWHYCDLNGGQASFLCPNGTIFSQVMLEIL